MRIGVVGGGISGLVAAYNLRRALPGARIVVIESSARLGGWLWTERTREGFLFENGCRGIRPQGNGSAAVRLVEDLGLESSTLLAPASAKRRFLWWRNALTPLPASLWGFLTSPLTRSAALAFLARDLPLAFPFSGRPATAPSTARAAPPATTAASPMLPGASTAAAASAKTGAAAPTPPGDALRYGSPTPYEDTSVHAFVLRHTGSRAAETLADAFLSGVYAGDATRLSAAAVLRPLWRYDQMHGSLLVGALREALLAWWSRIARKRRGDESSNVSVGGAKKASAPAVAAQMKTSELPVPVSAGGSSALGSEVAPRAAAAASAEQFRERCEKATSISFVGGMATLIEALARSLGIPSSASSAKTSAPGGELTRDGLFGSDSQGGRDVSVLFGRSLSRMELVPGSSARKNSGVEVASTRRKIVLTLAGASPRDEESLTFDHVVLALPANRLASVFSAAQGNRSDGVSGAPLVAVEKDVSSRSGGAHFLRAQLAGLLSSIPFGSLAIVCFGYKNGGLLDGLLRTVAPSSSSGLSAQIRKKIALIGGPKGATANESALPPLPPRSEGGGFGYLVPFHERSVEGAGGATAAQLGMIWDSLVFPGQQQQQQQRQPPVPGAILEEAGETRVSILMGGALHPHVYEESDRQLLLRGLRIATEQAQLPAAFDGVHIRRAEAAIPQYNVGHLETVKKVEASLQSLFGDSVTLLGNSFVGVGVADCIHYAVAKTDAIAAAQVSKK